MLELSIQVRKLCSVWWTAMLCTVHLNICNEVANNGHIDRYQKWCNHTPPSKIGWSKIHFIEWNLPTTLRGTGNMTVTKKCDKTCYCMVIFIAIFFHLLFRLFLTSCQLTALSRSNGFSCMVTNHRSVKATGSRNYARKKWMKKMLSMQNDTAIYGSLSISYYWHNCSFSSLLPDEIENHHHFRLHFTEFSLFILFSGSLSRLSDHFRFFFFGLNSARFSYTFYGIFIVFLFLVISISCVLLFFFSSLFYFFSLHIVWAEINN